MKRLLFYFPVNPLAKNAGNVTRALGFLEYFKKRNLEVDFVSEKHWGTFTDEGITGLKATGLVNEVYLLERKPKKGNPVSYFFGYKLPNKTLIRKTSPKGGILNRVTLHLQQQFNEVLSRKHYDYIIISYAFWADLIYKNPLAAKSLTIIDTHDLESSLLQHEPGFDVSVALGDELRRLELYDQVWAISPEESYFFSQFLGDRVKYIPMMLPDPIPVSSKTTPEYDLVYVASDNAKNIMSAAWFFSEVYPLLSPDIRLAVVGTITAHVPKDLPNVTLVPYVQHLETMYVNARVALSPMLEGTGVKVKVVEALSHGLPVVCTERGTDGLPFKSNNGCLVAETPGQFAQFVEQLLQDHDFYKKQCEMAKNTFLQCFSAEEVSKRLDAALSITG
ncbi:glycosyltransferase [Chitinophaga sp.]|uniref:glycosyltransferase n=1 Tax=Chitinophaga sp. TaxID=1869181 RepID=UPI0031D0C13F